MSADNDSPATHALFKAAIEVESTREWGSGQHSWHASVAEMLPPEHLDPTPHLSQKSNQRNDTPF